MRRALSLALTPTVQKCRYSCHGSTPNFLPIAILCSNVWCTQSSRYSTVARERTLEKPAGRLVDKELVRIRRFARVLQRSGVEEGRTAEEELLFLAKRVFRADSGDQLGPLGDGYLPAFVTRVEEPALADRSSAIPSTPLTNGRPVNERACALLPAPSIAVRHREPAPVLPDEEVIAHVDAEDAFPSPKTNDAPTSPVGSLLKTFSQMRASAPQPLASAEAIADHIKSLQRLRSQRRSRARREAGTIQVADDVSKPEVLGGRRLPVHDSPPSIGFHDTARPLSSKTALPCPPPPPAQLLAPNDPPSDPLRRIEDEAYDATALHDLNRHLNADSPEEAWEAFRTLSDSHPAGGGRLHPTTLHRFARLMARIRPRTRTGFLRMLAVVNDIRNSGTTTVETHEWNALIDYVGKGFRATTREDFDSSVGLYHDMIGYKPGAGPIPDTITYNTLLSIAARTRSYDAVARAGSFLSAHPGASYPFPPPDSITFQSLMPYYARTGAPERGIDILKTVISNGMPIRIDGLNAVMWGYARNGKKEVAMAVYAALRHHMLHPDKDWKTAVPQWEENPILSLAGLEFRRNLKCDVITYVLLIQQHCYDGELYPALRIFREMVAPPASLPASMVAFRALFRGFARHAGDPARLHSPSSLGVRLMTRRGALHVLQSSVGDSMGRSIGVTKPEDMARAERAMDWNMATLEQIFRTFVSLPWATSPNHNSVYTLLVGYARASGDDWDLLWEVWCTLEEKFADLPGWSVGSRLKRVTERIKTEREAKAASIPTSTTEEEVY